jgi:RimJ/RimL family protein N-acetyltransferase
MESNSSKNISLRPARKDDLETLFKWRNLPEIIALGSSQSVVKKNVHIRWFLKTLKLKTRRVFIICLRDLPIGQVRFELKKNKWIEISVYLLKSFRGFGFGVLAINLGCKHAFTAFPKAVGIFAFIREKNIASLRGFQKAGFKSDIKRPQRVAHRRLSIKRKSDSSQ